MTSHRHLISSQRLNRDVAELFSSNFDCTAAYLTVIQTADSLNELGSISLEVKVFEGPYRGGRFNFCFNIPASYPFVAVEVWAVHPIWHPNVELRTGKVAIPLEWSPVLTLKSTAIAVQMLMLEPSSENPMNLDAYSAYTTNPQEFDSQVQASIAGGIFAGVAFPSVTMTMSELSLCGDSKTVSKRNRSDSRTSCQMMPTSTIGSQFSGDGEVVTKRARRSSSDMDADETMVCRSIAQASLHDNWELKNNQIFEEIGRFASSSSSRPSISTMVGAGFIGMSSVSPGNASTRASSSAIRHVH